MAKGGKEIRTRIKSVRNTQQLTKAMKMVAASRLRKSEGRTAASRPYAGTLEAMMRDLAAVTADVEHPFLSHIAPEVPRVLVLFITSDRGLCGSYNTNLDKALDHFVAEQAGLGRQVRLLCAGKKGFKFAQQAGYEVHERFPGFTDKTAFADIKHITNMMTQAYLDREVAEVYVLYARFINVMRSEPVAVRLLPVSALPGAGEDAGSGPSGDFILEPSPEELLKQLLPRYFQTVLYQAALESFTSENGARMVAMDNATSAAGDMINDLTLQYNKARQSGITMELLDIIGGAEALKG
jgi:F-type H+-transporting ATPase subunit gamma